MLPQWIFLHRKTSIINAVSTTRSNEEWISQLSAAGHQQAAALADLREIIHKGLPYALQPWLSAQDERFAPLAEEVVQETLLRVLDKLNTFEGRSAFTTWVHKIAVRLALTELRRKRWRNVSLDAIDEDPDTPSLALLAIDSAPTPERAVEGADLIQRVMSIIAEELTDKQRQALAGVGIQGMPMEIVAQHMGTNRNALYKLLHDARLRLKKRLANEGLTPEDILQVFENV